MSSNRLAQFEREDRIAEADTLVSLHDIVERRVSVHWDEAVAIVEEFCDGAIASAGETAPVPDLENVLIGSDGHVTLGRMRGDKSPTAAGRMLHALLSNGDVPTPLRLFVTQSTSQGTHQSLWEFARGLAYFAKPGRQRLIGDVYARYAQTGPHGAGARPEPSPLPESVYEPTTNAGGQLKAKRHSIKRSLVAAAAVVLAGSAVWLGKSGRPAPDVQASAARVLSHAVEALATLGQQVRGTLGPATAAPTPATAESIDNRERSRTKRRASSPSAKASEVEPAPLASRQLSPPMSARAWQLAAAPSAMGFEPAAVYEQPTEAAAPQSAVYSSADLDVEPPALIVPQLTPPLARPGASSGTVNRMVVVVSPEGTVERVQLVEGPARMVDMMLLSGAKTWRFTPALKDGEPVRYRTVVSWTAVP